MNRLALPLALAVGLTVSCRPESPKAPDGIWLTEIGSGPVTLIVLHGGPAMTHRYLRPEWDALADEARLVYYDQRGCGWSEPTDSVSWERHVADLDSIVAAVRDDAPVVLAGSSWGSILAVLYAYRHPDRITALVLSGVPDLEGRFFPASGPRFPHVVHRAVGERERTGAFPDAMIPDSEAEPSWVRVDSVVRHEDSTVLYMSDSTRITARVGARSVQDSAEVAADTAVILPQLAARMGMACPSAAHAVLSFLRKTAPPLDSLSAIHIPVLIVRGEEVTIVGDGSEQLAGVLPNARVETVQHAGHDPWFEQPGRFFELVRDFLREAEDQAGGL